jgi:CRP/FNR family transcriptional regulator, cyclic AMP receptor protein
VTARELERYRDVVAHSVVFEHLTSPDIDRILPACRLLDVPPGQVILAEGELGDGLYIILEGEVEVFLPEQGAGGVKRRGIVQLNVLGSGRCFGEYGIVDDNPSSASVRAVAPSKLCALARTDFRRIMEANDRIAKVVYANLLRFLIRRLRVKDQELDFVLLLEENPEATSP